MNGQKEQYCNKEKVVLCENKSHYNVNFEHSLSRSDNESHKSSDGKDQYMNKSMTFLQNKENLDNSLLSPRNPLCASVLVGSGKPPVYR